jgi:hypothetical protein
VRHIHSNAALQAAEDAVQFVAHKLNASGVVDFSDARTFPNAINFSYSLRTGFPVSENPWNRVYTPLVQDVFACLGAGSVAPLEKMGWFPVTYPGIHAPPWKWYTGKGSWHVDGRHFRHMLHSKEQARPLAPLWLAY